MRLVQYINETSYDSDKNRSVSMSIDEAIPLIKKNCKKIYNYYKLEHHERIYRGNYNIINTAAFIDPSKFERRSRNTSNYYTLLMSNLPSWQQYPPRSGSIICSNYEGRAEAYGGENVYLVLPYDSCKIGIAPVVDIFVVEIPRLYRIRFEEFNSEIAMLLRSVYNKSLGFDENWNTLKKYLTKITDLKDAKTASVLVEAFNDAEDKNMLVFLDRIMDPNVLGFRVVRPGQKIPNSDGFMNSNEIWVGNGPSILVSIYHLEEIGLPVIEGVKQLGKDE